MVQTVARHVLPSLLAILAGCAALAGPAAAWQLTAAPFPAPSIAAAVPANVAVPGISGAVAAGSVLTASTGTWTGAPTSFAYQWERDAGAGFGPVSGATTSAYVLASGDTATRLRVVVNATNATGTTVATASAVGPVGAAVPTSSAPPAISGTPKRGMALYAAPGTWNPAGALAFQWERDSGSGFTPITGATASTYTPTGADIAAILRVTVVATNAYGSTSASSVATAPVAAAVPVNTVAPSFSGTLKRTFVLTAAAGAWTPAGATFGFQWQRDTGAGFADIAGATASTYTLATADVGAHVRVLVTATNPDGSVATPSPASGVVAAATPASVTPPVLAGATRIGDTLSTSNGSWSPAATGFAHQWQRDTGPGFADISGATGTSYTLVAADLGARLRVRVTATNGDGSGQAVSAAGAVVTQPPVVVTAPDVPIGTLTDTATLTADHGTWNPSSVTLTYQWLRCAATATSIGSACQVLGNGETYTLVGGDVGRRIGVRITAMSPGGVTAANSALTAVVSGRVLTNITPPAIAGAPRIADKVSVSPGAWTVPPSSLAYQWQRCAADGTGCADIAGASAPSYTPTAADHGLQIAVRETATSPGRTAAVASAPVAVADEPLPASGVAPSIAGTARRTELLRSAAGTWSAKPTAFGYQWQRCAADGTACADIAGATQATYRLVAADVGRTIVVAVSATNASGTATAASAPTAVVAAALPIARNTPSITGAPQVPNSVQILRPAWDAPADTRFTVQWKRCDGAGANCADIAGATGQLYKLVPADVDATLRVAAIATNPDGGVTALSPASAPIRPAAPGFAVRPRLSISANPAQVGRTLQITHGTWVNDVTTMVPTLWRCAPRCVAADLARALSYTLTTADAGAVMRLSETATGAGGPTTAWATASYGPVRGAAVAVAKLGPGGSAPVVSASGTPLAGASVSSTTGAAAAAVAARSVRVTVLRRPGAGRRPLRTWACRTPAAADDSAPCTSAVTLRARVTVRLALARGQRVQVVVAPARRSVK